MCCVVGVVLCGVCCVLSVVCVLFVLRAMCVLSVSCMWFVLRELCVRVCDQSCVVHVCAV